MNGILNRINQINPINHSSDNDMFKVHGGEIKVESKEGETRPPARLNHSGGDDSFGRRTEFIIALPV
jgi:hypothetical protein